MDFEVIGEIVDVETIASGTSVRIIARLRRAYGARRWKKLKGVATLRLSGGELCKAEVHWYEPMGSAGKR